MNAENADASYDIFLDNYTKLLDKHAPFKPLSKRERKSREKPWITPGIQKSISKKRALFKKFKNDKLKNKESPTYQQYKTYNDTINKLKKISKKNYYQKYFNENFQNSKKIWTGINTLLNRHKKKQNTIYLEDKGFISDPHLVANKFNDFFLNIADKLSAKIVNKNTKYQDYLKNPNQSSFFLKETTPDETSKIIKGLDGKKSGDIHNISPDFVILSNQAVSQSLTIIFNRCVLEGCFPSAMKLAKIIPLHKGDSVLSVANYRPISLLPIFSKIFERMIYDQFSDYITKNKILSELQFGFQKNKSTEQAISSITTHINKAFSNKQSAYCIFLDFAKAFDTVNHDILIDKLKYYGVKNKTLSLFASYLSNRKQVTEINGKMSDSGIIKNGVPQGSILGPLLFLLYINDISQSSDILTFFLFADDTTVFLQDFPSNNNTENTLNTELEKVSCWLAANKLSLNVKKSNFLHFHHGKSKKPTLNIKINDVPVEEKLYTKYLGTFIDNKLSWKTQIQHTKTKLSKGIGMISKIRYYLNEQCIKNMYFSFIHSHINYNLINWSCAHRSTLLPIENKIKKAIRTISFAKTKYDHTSPLFKQHKILPFFQLVEHRKASFLWKISQGLIPSPTSNIFTKNQRNPLHYVLPLPNQILEYTCVKAWNAVPENQKQITNLKTFNSKLREHLLTSII